MESDYPDDFMCPTCGALHERCFYSATLPRKNRKSYFRYVCPNGHEWIRPEKPPLDETKWLSKRRDMTIKIEITRIEQGSSEISFGEHSCHIYGTIDGGKEKELHRYFHHQDELPRYGFGGIVPGLALAALRHYGICETCFEHQGRIVYGPMMHGIHGYFCDCCLAKQALEFAEEKAAEIPALKERYIEAKSNCS